MAKLALLIGVSEYGEGIPSLSAPPNDVKAMEEVLQNPLMGEFDEIESLVNPDLLAMRKSIQQLFKKAKKQDLILFYFSGHGLTDDEGHLYLSNINTEKDFFQSTSVPADFIQDQSRESYCKRQVLILDCCYGGAFKEGWKPRDVGGIELEKELGAEGRVVLTASSAAQKAFEQEGEDLGLYTKYLVEGISTGAADKDGDGKIYISELHKYAQQKVQEAKPKMKPQIINDQEGFSILISHAPVDDPYLDFRQLVEESVRNGEINPIRRAILDTKRIEMQIDSSKVKQILDEVLAPHRQHRQNIEIYRTAVQNALQETQLIDEDLIADLDDLQNILGLEEKDIERSKKQALNKISEIQNKETQVISGRQYPNPESNITSEELFIDQQASSSSDEEMTAKTTSNDDANIMDDDQPSDLIEKYKIQLRIKFGNCSLAHIQSIREVLERELKNAGLNSKQAGDILDKFIREKQSKYDENLRKYIKLFEVKYKTGYPASYIKKILKEKEQELGLEKNDVSSIVSNFLAQQKKSATLQKKRSQNHRQDPSYEKLRKNRLIVLFALLIICLLGGSIVVSLESTKSDKELCYLRGGSVWRCNSL